MRSLVRLARGPIVASACLALASCGLGGPEAIDVAVIGGAESPFASGARLPLAAQMVRAATAEGLVGLDEDGRIVPGIADRWIVTDDGLSYIFRVRDGNWPDGTPISSDTARLALHQAIEAQRGTPLALDLAGIEEIRAMAGRVIEVRLVRPMPDLLQLLAQPELGLAHRGRGAGPMALTRAGAVAILHPLPPEKLGLPAVDGWSDLARPVRLRALDGPSAREALAQGRVALVIGGTFLDLPRPERLTLIRTPVRLDPVTGLFGLVVLRAEGLLATPDLREALAMAIDRGSLATALAPAGWAPTSRLVGYGLAGDTGAVGERWYDQDIDHRRAVAGRRVAQWLQAGHGPAVVAVALPKGAGADLLFDRLSSDFNEIGVKLVRSGPGRPADLALLDEVARYPRARWFLDQLACGTGRALCSRDADDLVAKARAEPDETKAEALFADAEVALTKANVFIPFGPPIRWCLARGDLPGLAVNRTGFHNLLPLSMQGK